MVSQTKLQRTATERLLALPGRFRVVADREGWPTIPGRYGRIEFDNYAWTAYTESWRIFRRLTALPGVYPHQTGDGEFRTVVRYEALDPVAKVLGAKRRRSADTAKHLVATAYSSTKSPMNAPLAQEVA
jgi:hypothetical protein